METTTSAQFTGTVPVKDHVTCLLCHSQARLLEEVSTTTLAFLYRKFLLLDIPAAVTAQDAMGFYYCPECGLKFFSPGIAGDEVFYQELQKKPWYYSKDKYEYQLASKYIKAGAEVLDVGSGTGKFADSIPQANFTGLELNPDCLLPGTGRRILNETIQYHATRQPEQYDAVTTFQVLEHISEPHPFIQACVDAVRPGGILVISVPNEDSFFSQMQNGILNMPPHHITRWSNASLAYVGKLFDLTPILIEEGPLKEAHRPLYRSAFINAGVRKALGMKPRLLDTSLPAKLVQRFSDVMGKLMNPISPGHVAGHTITAIYRKEG